MTREELLDDHKDIPEIIESSIEMTEANSSFKIYEGEYLLKSDTEEIKVNGIITFDWVANSGSHFSGKAVLEPSQYKAFSNSLSIYKIVVDGLEFGNGFITKNSFGSNFKGCFIKGTLSQQAVFGDKSIAVEKIIFSIPNFREIHGLPVKKITSKNSSISMNRLRLENDNYIISIDKCSDYKERQESLEEKGGYVILYYGELTSKKGPLKLEDTKEVFHCLDTFLTFINGRRTSAMFLQGVYAGEVIWCDYTDYFVDPYKIVQSWPQRHSIRGLNELWQNFSLLWKETEDKNFLTSAIHWYVEANGNRGFSEGSIIMAQTALELLYNWWIIEHKKLIVGKDSENINASNKIRLLLSQLNITHSVPEAFKQLQQFIAESKDIIDAPDAVVQIRNAIVHSQEEKRKKLSAIHYKAKYEALQLCIWYIEMTLLCILNFDDIYFNRCSKEIHVSKAEELVPWTKKKIVQKLTANRGQAL
jgi:hypothetical protein